MSLFARVNETYARVFGDHKPTRAIVPCGELPAGLLIEIDAVAVAG